MISDSGRVVLRFLGDPTRPKLFPPSSYGGMDRDRAEELVRSSRLDLRDRPDIWSTTLQLGCHCCGSTEIRQRQGGQRRCARHVDRNPCAIEGCTRTTAAPESGRLADDSWMCSTHWRRYCPPRSRRRRAYHAFWRQAKRQGGWDSALVDRFHRFWERLIASARARSAAGTLDEAAIAKLFGWDES